MAVIKIKALQRLADLVACEIKELKGSICAGPATNNHQLGFPSLSIVPERFSFIPNQPSEYNYVTKQDRCPSPVTVVMDVGRWEGEIVMRLGAKTPFKRYELEHQIEQLFLGDVTGASPDALARFRPGILLVDVPECNDARIAFELQNDTWRDEKVFANKWFSELRILAQIPALVPWKPVYTIDTLQLSLTEDLETAVPDSETVQINADGSITAVP